MLSDEDISFLFDCTKKLRSMRELLGATGDDALFEAFDVRIAKIQKELEQPVKPLELLIHCPRCLKQHVDEGHFATHAHTKHACQFCGLAFVASKQPSIGVQFFSGWKNDLSKQF